MKRNIFGLSFSHSVKTVLLSLLLLVLLITVNLATALLPRDFTVLDVSYNKLYTLSEASRKSVSALSESVTLYFLCDSGVEDTTIRTFLDRYASLSPYVTVKVVDPVENPTFAAKYTDRTLSNYSVILEGKKRSLALDYYDLYLWENEILGILTADEYVSAMSDSYGSYILSTYPTEQHFNGEAKLTNGISFVTAESVPKLYAVSNHGEAALGAGLLDTLKANAYEVVSGFSMLAYGGIPEDCEVLLINAPKSDLTKEETEWINAYLSKGGALLLTTDASKYYSDFERIPVGSDEAAAPELVKNDFPYLTDLLGGYGLSAANGIVIESDKNLSYSKYPFVLLPTPNQEHPITAGLSASSVVFYTAHGIRVNTSVNKNAAPLFTTSDGAYTSLSTSTESYEKDESSESGPFALGAVASVGKGSVVWLSSSTVLDDTVNSLVSGGNHALAVSVCDVLTDREESITLPSVSLEEPKLIVTGSTVYLLTALFCAIIPFSILFGGLIYCRKRRKA